MASSLTSDQKEAILALLSWIKNPTSPFITLGGFAGTGKTTVVGVLRKLLHRENPNLRVAFCAYTGKASQVLNLSLQANQSLFPKDKVSTIHSLIYEAVKDILGANVGWKKRSSLPMNLIVVDEASMVNQQIWYDLLGFNIPIIAVGDHGQLPPIEGTFSLIKEPTLRLEKIHRQAELSPIIRVSQYARQEGRIPVKKFGKGVIKYSRSDSDIGNIVQDLVSDWDEKSLFLVGTNRSRLNLNNQIRQNREFDSKNPEIGDRVICLKNNWQADIYNGQLGKIIELEKAYDDNNKCHWYDVDLEFDDGRVFSGKISAHQFGSPTTLKTFDELSGKQLGDLFDFGYALTVHKAQGSQAHKVVVFEERNSHMSDEDWRRWLYTAVTRAEKELIIVGD